MDRRLFIAGMLILPGCSLGRFRPVAGLTLDMVELHRSAEDFAEIYRPFYEEVKAAQLDFTDDERETLTRAHEGLVQVGREIETIYDSASNPRKAFVVIDRLEAMVGPLVRSVDEARPIILKKRDALSIENQARLDSGLALFDQASAQAVSIASSEDAQEAQAKIKTLLTVGATIIKIAALA